MPVTERQIATQSAIPGVPDGLLRGTSAGTRGVLPMLSLPPDIPLCIGTDARCIATTQTRLIDPLNALGLTAADLGPGGEDFRTIAQDTLIEGISAVQELCPGCRRYQPEALKPQTLLERMDAVAGIKKYEVKKWAESGSRNIFKVGGFMFREDTDDEQGQGGIHVHMASAEDFTGPDNWNRLRISVVLDGNVGKIVVGSHNGGTIESVEAFCQQKASSAVIILACLRYIEAKQEARIEKNQGGGYRLSWTNLGDPAAENSKTRVLFTF
jgi:hypothetical protein